ncbi:hypothetical protein C8R43DRAFT_958926 [Mycena crocata]|nr:hypothetical protein C8R43DRAFT_958926 [Mycena crocata]
MTSTRPPLDAAIKAERRQAALKRYALKHARKLRLSSQERMQRFRSKTPTEQQKAKKLASAKEYRERNRESIRAADSLRRAEERLLTKREEDERKARAQLKHEQRARQRRTPPTPKPQPRMRSRQAHVSCESEPSPSDSESETQHDAEIPERVFYSNPARPRSPTPDSFCQCTWPKYCPKCTCGCDYMCCLYHHEDESEYRKWMKELTCEERGLPSPYKERESGQRVCGPELARATQTNRSRLLPSPARAMVRFEWDSGVGSRVNCIPTYFPHSSHSHSMLEHSRGPEFVFYAVFDTEYSGIYTDFSQIREILREFPDADVDVHGEWNGIMKIWRASCTKSHDHAEEQLKHSSRSSSPLADASAFDTSPGGSPALSRTPSPEIPPISKPIPFFDSPRSSSRMSSPQKAPLRSSSTSPIKISARSSSKKAVSLPPPSFGPPRLLPFPDRLLPERGIFPAEVSASSRRAVQSELPQYTLTSVECREDVDVPSSVAETRPPVVYAVSIINTVFRNRHDGTDVFLTRHVNEITHFFERSDPLRAGVSSTRPVPIYAVSGHRTAFQNRERAYACFLRSEGSQLRFARSSDEAEAFIMLHSEI